MTPYQREGGGEEKENMAERAGSSALIEYGASCAALCKSHGRGEEGGFETRSGFERRAWKNRGR